jgi:hypothetical protein
MFGDMGFGGGGALKHTLPLNLKPSDGACGASTIGFVAEIGDDFGKGLSAI